MTTIRKASGHTQQGNHVWDVPCPETAPIWDPDAIARMYDEAKANIADEAGTWTQDEDEPWPETEEIQVYSVHPSAAAHLPSPEPPTEHLGVEPPEVAPRPQRAWRRWFTRE